jgi:hypothetical protein
MDIGLSKPFDHNVPVLQSYTENYLSLIFHKINDFVHKFILDHKYVDFTILVVNFTILYC